MGKGLANCVVWGIADWLVPFRTGRPGFRSWLCHFTSRRLNLSKQEHQECVQSCALHSPAWRLLSKSHPIPAQAADPQGGEFLIHPGFLGRGPFHSH